MQKIIDRLFPIKTAYAHCDIPCGIYDPHGAQMAAHTVLRMTLMLEEMKLDVGEDEVELKKSHQQLTRLVRVKENHAQIVEEELVTLWSDYFKEEHFKEFPQITELVQKALKLTGKTRQGIDKASAEELLAKTQEIAEIFYKTKGRDSKRVKSVYPTEGEIVVLA